VKGAIVGAADAVFFRRIGRAEVEKRNRASLWARAISIMSPALRTRAAPDKSGVHCDTTASGTKEDYFSEPSDGSARLDLVYAPGSL
jgi:hypothetical protein